MASRLRCVDCCRLERDWRDSRRFTHSLTIQMSDSEATAALLVTGVLCGGCSRQYETDRQRRARIRTAVIEDCRLR